MDLILASTSPYRRALLERLGVPFRCVAPPVDEEALKRELAGTTPVEMAGRLALAKALAVAALEPGAVSIGGDQLVSFQGAILGKPGSADRAVEQLRAMSGRSHELITSVRVVRGGHLLAIDDVTRLRMRPLTHEEIDRYVEADRPHDCAGSYKLEARGIALFERIESDDQTAIIGLPLIALSTTLRSLGFAIP